MLPSFYFPSECISYPLNLYYVTIFHCSIGLTVFYVNIFYMTLFTYFCINFIFWKLSNISYPWLDLFVFKFKYMPNMSVLRDMIILFWPRDKHNVGRIHFDRLFVPDRYLSLTERVIKSTSNTKEDLSVYLV